MGLQIWANLPRYVDILQYPWQWEAYGFIASRAEGLHSSVQGALERSSKGVGDEESGEPQVQVRMKQFFSTRFFFPCVYLGSEAFTDVGRDHCGVLDRVESCLMVWHSLRFQP